MGFCEASRGRRTVVMETPWKRTPSITAPRHRLRRGSRRLACRAPALTLSIVRRRLPPIVATLAGVAVVALLLYGVSAQSPNRTLDELVAKRAYPLAPQASRRLPLLGGRGERTLASLRGKVVVLNFWASWCTPCKEEAALLERAQGALERHGATVIGVTYQDDAPESESFVRAYRITYPSVRDASGEFAHSYGTRQVPESFLIDREGRIVAIERGEIEQRFVDRALALAEST
jgi:cytochrome c biogenesis protein CcmG, thiol:disulfide interchange protein DsbE